MDKSTLPNMTDTQLLEGKKIAAEIQQRILADVQKFSAKGLEQPSLVALQAKADPSSEWYINQQEKLAAKLGIQFKKITPERISNQTAFIQEVAAICKDSKVHGVFMAMPFPKEFDTKQIFESFDPDKDVEGVDPASLGFIMLRQTRLIPPTAFAAFTLIKSTGISLRGKKAVVIGQSAIVGRPLLLLLGEERVTATLCNTGTSTEDLRKFVSDADIVVACAGNPGLVKGDWIKKGAVVIDVGTTEINGKLVGDVEFETAAAKASYITPVPGGVGPLTVTMLMQNLINAYKWQKGIS